MKKAGIGLLVLGGLLYAALGDPEEHPEALLGAGLMLVGILLYFRGRQLAAKSLAEGPASPLRDSKPDVLYLRSFRADASSPIKVLQSGFSTEEEQLADVLRPFGDMVAIGRPGEPLPLPGAARIYATDSEWKTVVLDRMRIAPLVVIRAGKGAGIFWELGQAISTLNPEKLLILVFNITTQEYREFADRAMQQFQLTLPNLGAYGVLRTLVDYRENPSKVLAGFVRFSSAWTPEFLPLRFTLVRLGYNDFRNSFNAALRPVFERHGLPWHPKGRFGA